MELVIHVNTTSTWETNVLGGKHRFKTKNLMIYSGACVTISTFIIWDFTSQCLGDVIQCVSGLFCASEMNVVPCNKSYRLTLCLDSFSGYGDLDFIGFLLGCMRFKGRHTWQLAIKIFMADPSFSHMPCSKLSKTH